MNTNEFLHKHLAMYGRGSCRVKELTPKMRLADGFTMSVQASDGHYCNPRNDIGPYRSVEIGYPSEAEQLIIEYAESPEYPTDTVYGYVPVEIADAVIEKHGGIKE